MSQAFVIFTDASGSGNTAYFSSQGQKVVQTGFSTAQHAELQVVILACQDFVHVPFALYTDSAYVYGVLKTIETAYIGPANDEQLFHLLHELRALLQQCQHPYFVSHLRSHSGLPGPLAEGNSQANALVSPLILQVDNSSPVNQAIQSSIKTPELFINIFISPKNKLVRLLSHVQNLLLICLCPERELTLMVFVLYHYGRWVLLTFRLLDDSIMSMLLLILTLVLFLLLQDQGKQHTMSTVWPPVW
jgi:hypothetical protein